MSEQPRSGSGEGLRPLWSLFRAFLTGLLFFLVVVLLVLDTGGPSDGPGWFAYVLGGGSFVGVLGVFYAKSRPLDLSSAEAVARSFRSAGVLGMAFAEGPALLGFMGAFIVEELWPYLVGLAVSVACLGVMAPMGREIDRRQQQITAQGSPLSLRHALSGSGS